MAMLRCLLVLGLLAVLAGGHPAWADGLAVTGAVAREKPFSFEELTALGTVTERLKLGSEQIYRGAFEVTAVSLDRILDAAGIKKVTPDGFNRELDLYVQLIDRSGKKAVYSYGEIFLATRKNQVLLTVGVRYLLPHKHPDIKGQGLVVEEWSPFGRDLLAKSEKANCQTCHNGSAQQKLAPPAGFCGFAPDEVWHGRILEDIVEVRVGQVPVDTTKELKPQKKESMWVETPVLILPDGKRVEITGELTGSLPRLSRRDCSFGLGKGFHGIQIREGIDAAALLKSQLSGIDWRKLCVLITCADGYRSTFSGGELFGSEMPGRYLLVDKENGQILKDRSGKYKFFPQADFYVDRCLRSVWEIRCFIP